MDSFSDEIRSGVRQRKKHTDPTCCPVCGVTVRSHEMEQHYTLEVDRLHKQSYRPRKSQSTKEQQMPSCSSTTGTSKLSPNTEMADGNECWSTYQRIKNNRHARLKMKNRKRKADDPLCPVCNQRVPDDIQAHVELCLKRSEGRTNGNGSDDDDDSDSVDVEAESFDEYEWAGHSRVRAASLLEGGYQAAGIGTTIINNKSNNGDDDDEDEDLNVDVDDTQVFGATQYTERDVILPLISNNNKKETERLLYLRNLATGAGGSDGGAVTIEHDCMMNEDDVTALMTDCDEVKASSSWMNAVGDQTSAVDFSATQLNHLPQQKQQQQGIAATAMTNGSDGGQKQIIESLKKKIREYELQIRNKSKCLICIDEFRIPVVSICCWHVHCEECWLRTLGARKLCPQCNMITSPSDLRRIYM